jgi:tRNA A-37 threonylcarbamoyl transferase component Bud32
MIKTNVHPIWFDIETGGVDPSQSSILSIATKQGDKLRSSFIRPEAGSFLSSFSEEKILPQLTGKSLISERDSIKSFISNLQANPEAPLAGFNIRGFDIGFIQRRARNYGLESSFTKAISGRQILDPIFQVKDTIASSVMKHALSGLYSEDLGNRTWEEAHEAFRKTPFKQRPPQYNLLSQIEGYLKSNDSAAMFKGWKLEDINSILTDVGGEASIGGAAHEAATDILMTQRVTEAARNGKLEQVLSTPEGGRKWMDLVSKRGFYQLGPSAEQLVSLGPELGKGPAFEGGRILSKLEVDEISPTLTNRVISTLKKHPGKIALGAVAAVIASSIFSGRDDDYNTIEGLPHGNMAQSGRLRLTPFGSGWNGLRNLLQGTETIEDMVKSSTFQKAIQSATKVSDLNAGQFGTAQVMKTYFRGQDLSFVRKIGDIQPNEVESMMKFSDKFAPDVYASGKNFIDMELFEGGAFYKVADQVRPEHLTRLTENIMDIHKQGYIHGDIHSGNVFLTKSGNVGLIDWGTAGRIGTDATMIKEGRQVLVNDMSTRATSYDYEGLNRLVNEIDPTAVSSVNKLVSSGPQTVSHRKRGRAALQRQASAVSWNNGTNGGRRSRT